jgi:hypothetical protein
VEVEEGLAEVGAEVVALADGGTMLRPGGKERRRNGSVEIVPGFGGNKDDAPWRSSWRRNIEDALTVRGKATDCDTNREGDECRWRR